MLKNNETIGCSTCHIRHLCLPQDISDTDLSEFNQSVKLRKVVKKGGVIISAGSQFHSIFAIRTGSFKTFLQNENGHGHLSGFQMAGSSLGMDGIAKSIYTSDATALEDSSVCMIPFNEIEALSRKFPKFQRRFLIAMSDEISRENKNLIHFSQMNADQKVANFLYDLLAKLKLRGFSGRELNLRMTRLEIGQHLGLTLETISRAFSKLAKKEVLTINKRHVTILDKSCLELICDFK
jgi:CRP/FNR family transcriptional regulator